jgi:hypothetical protein
MTQTVVPEFWDLKVAAAVASWELNSEITVASSLCADELSASINGVLLIGGTVKKAKYLPPALYMIWASAKYLFRIFVKSALSPLLPYEFPISLTPIQIAKSVFADVQGVLDGLEAMLEENSLVWSIRDLTVDS